MSGRPVISIDGRFSWRPPVLVHGDLQRELPFKRSIFGSLVLAGFVAAFSTPYFFAGEMVGGPPGSMFSVVMILFMGFFLMGWSVGVGILVLFFIGSLIGQERLVLKEGSLLIRLEVLGIGFGRYFDGRSIEDLKRVEPEKGSPHAWRGAHMLFLFGEEEVRFGCNVDRRTAELLVEDVISRVLIPAEKQPVTVAVPGEGEGEKEGTAEAAQVELSSLSAVALILANLIPLAGVFLFDWRVGDVMLLYWAESAVIGIFNLAKMYVISPVATVILGLFFVGHFGGFMVGHLFFIYGLIIQGGEGDTDVDTVIADFLALWPALVALFASHWISFHQNYLGRREYEGKQVAELMGAPYRRIMVMHITILLGGFLVLALGDAIPALVLLIVLKVAVDLRAHLGEHRQSIVT